LKEATGPAFPGRGGVRALLLLKEGEKKSAQGIELRGEGSRGKKRGFIALRRQPRRGEGTGAVPAKQSSDTKKGLLQKKTVLLALAEEKGGEGVGSSELCQEEGGQGTEVKLRKRGRDYEEGGRMVEPVPEGQGFISHNDVGEGDASCLRAGERREMYPNPPGGRRRPFHRSAKEKNC